jgi:hypothetical protein
MQRVTCVTSKHRLSTHPMPPANTDAIIAAVQRQLLHNHAISQYRWELGLSQQKDLELAYFVNMKWIRNASRGTHSWQSSSKLTVRVKRRQHGFTIWYLAPLDSNISQELHASGRTLYNIFNFFLASNLTLLRIFSAKSSSLCTFFSCRAWNT